MNVIVSLIFTAYLSAISREIMKRFNKF